MPQRPGTLTVSCCHSPGLLPLGVARKVGLRTGAPPSTPTRGVPSGHLGGERSPILAHWLHHDGYGGGQPLVVHLRREEEVISADDGHAESGRSAEEGAQRVAAAHLGAGGMAGGGGTPACPRSSQPHTQAEPRTAAREFGRVSKDRAWRRWKDPFLRKRCFWLPTVALCTSLCLLLRSSFRIRSSHFTSPLIRGRGQPWNKQRSGARAIKPGRNSSF